MGDLVTCPSCKTAVSSEARLCPSCGTHLRRSPIADRRGAAERWLIAVLAVAALLVVYWASRAP